MKREEREKRPVTVFGAGIAGLTAAHELAMRDFDVQVIDADYNEEWKDLDLALDRGIGGMARSQWAIAPNTSIKSRSRTAGGFEIGKDWVQRLWSAADLLRDKVIDFGPTSTRPLDEEHARQLLERLAQTLRALEASGVPLKFFAILIPIADENLILNDRRVLYLIEEFAKLGFTHNEVMTMVTPWDATMKLQPTRIYFSPSGGLAAAEHGFRFFPSFYRHLFDTMRRTRILKPRESERTKATVIENLVPADGLGFARANKAVSFIVPRRAVKSFEAVRGILYNVLEELEYTLTDIARFELKLFKYMTSSSARRRAEYENLSWGAFLEAERYSDISRTHIEYGPQMSAALRGSQSDARTQGNITVQLLLDQLKPEALADYVLAGPTNGAWFDHWHDFLIGQKVRFARGKLKGFTVHGGKVHPVVSGAQPTGQFFVLALSLPEIAKLADSFIEAATQVGVSEHKLRDFHCIKSFAGDTESDLMMAGPRGPLQHLSGIQYYFEEDARFWRGHTQYLDSPWGLTSISQSQFWSRARNPNDNYRSILSVDIGIFNRPYRGKTAWECTPEEIARLAWEQIYDHHDDAFKKKYGRDAVFPTPIAYALDANLRFPQLESKDKTNYSPFLVNQTGKYSQRPGNVITGKDKSKFPSLYEVIAGPSDADATWGYVLAGTFMKTFTRLTSMEGANESARHAVNALFQFWRIGGDRCDIWDPEDNELEDLQWFKDLDEKLLEHRLPHFTDILGWSELPEQLLPHHMELLTHITETDVDRRLR